ncbi:MAG: cytochrome c-type biosis protein [Patescibacteria group bacterium]|nr:cytochrome c-type biosis protein [Patescibacteria group bacterium]
MEIVFLIGAFFAGVFMFVAPCTLPLVPGFLSFVSAGEKKKVILNTLFFILGFSVVFILLGALTSFLGSKLFIVRSVLSKVGGILIIIFGLYILRVFRLPFFERATNIFHFKHLKPGNSGSAFVLGVSFAAGWSPCVGPILASILLIAGNTETVLVGTFLLSVFSLGLALPFLVTAILAHRMKNIFKKISENEWVYKLGGALLIFIGVLLFTDNFYLLIRWGFQALNFFGYEKILNFL